MTDISNIANDLEKQKISMPYLGIVTKATGKGVQLKVDGEDAPRETFYNSLEILSQGDRVYLQYVSGSIIVLGKLKY